MSSEFVRDIAKYLPAHIVPVITGFVSIPVITRLFVPQDYGNYSLVLATVTVLGTLLGWLRVSIIRFYPVYESEDKLDFFYGNILKLSAISILVMTLACLIVLLAVRSHISPQLYLLMYAGIGVFIVMGVFNVLQHFLRSMRRVGWYSFFSAWRYGAGLGLGLGLIALFRAGIEGLLWGTILSVAIIMPLLWQEAGGALAFLRTKLDLSLLSTMARYSFPLVIGNLAAWILSLSDRYILEGYRGAQEVGIYCASYDIADRSIRLVASIFLLASGPLSMRIWEREGESKSKDFLSRVTRYYLICAVPAVVGIGVLAQPIMRVMTGTAYSEGHKIVPFVATGMLLLGLQERYQPAFLFHKRTSFIAYAIVCSGLLNLLLNLWFVPMYGYYAAAVTTLISYGLLLVSMVVLSRRFFVWQFPFKAFIRVALASALMGTVAYVVSTRLASWAVLSVLSGICTGAMAYVVALMLLREFRPAEIRELMALKSRSTRGRRESPLDS
jgi:O-antigen/teichoic acid export membrane protein